MKRLKRFYRNESGVALIWAILMLTVVSIAVTTVLMMQNADIKEIMFLENRLSAYYASYGGMEFGLAALMSSYSGAGGKTLLEYYIDNPSLNLQSYVYEYKDTSGNNVATATIRVFEKEIASTRWVVVESIGEDLDSHVKVVNYMRINTENVYEVHRDGAALPTN